MKTADIALIDRLRQRKSLPGNRQESGKSCAEKTVFVIDRSGSMSYHDYPPSRLRAAVLAVENYIAVKNDTAPADLAGAVTFDSYANVVCRNCSMKNAEVSLLAPLRKVDSEGGTDILKGLSSAANILADTVKGVQNRIVLLTDGHGGRPEKVAQDIKNHGIVIDVIGIGGSPSDVNEACLKEVASTVNGQLRYRFIGDKELLVEHFREIATALVRVR